MKKTIFVVCFAMMSMVLHANSALKIEKLAQKGERIVSALCDREKLPQKSTPIEALTREVKESKACPPLSSAQYTAIAHYLSRGEKPKASHIEVPHDAKCPVCGMFVSKYPKWSASVKRDKTTYYFDGVKDMMKYILFDGDFLYDRKEISWIHVSDYYTIESIVAQDAFYVLGSDVFGPMGHELIAFKTQKSAETFMQEHHGKKIIPFDAITDKVIMTLDGVE